MTQLEYRCRLLPTDGQHFIFQAFTLPLSPKHHTVEAVRSPGG